MGKVLVTFKAECLIEDPDVNDADLEDIALEAELESCIFDKAVVYNVNVSFID